MLAAICCADDVVLVAASVAAAAEVMVAEEIAQLKEVGVSVGAQNRSIVVDGLAVLWSSWNLWDRRCVWPEVPDTRLHTEQLKPTSEQVSGEVETRFEVLMAPKNVAPEHCKNHNVSGVQRQSRHTGTKLRAGVREWWQT